jgi:plastocyanin
MTPLLKFQFSRGNAWRRRFRLLIYVLGVTALIGLPALAEEHLITQQDRAFSQREISIKVGESIVFKNDDQVTHNVFSVSPGMEFDIRRQAPGQSSTVAFKKPGLAEVRCSIHPKMKLIVTVTQ